MKTKLFKTFNSARRGEIFLLLIWIPLHIIDQISFERFLFFTSLTIKLIEDECGGE